VSEHKAVVWFGDDPTPNTFFFRSPFRSWKFLINTVLLVIVSLLAAFVLPKMAGNTIFVILTFFVLNVVYPYWWALIRHERVNELYRAGKIAEQPAESPQNVILEVADSSMNEGLRNTSAVFGILLLGILLGKLHYFK